MEEEGSGEMVRGLDRQFNMEEPEVMEDEEEGKYMIGGRKGNRFR